MDLDSLTIEAHQTAIGTGFWDPGVAATFVESCMLIVTEVAEAVEDYRHGRDHAEIYYTTGTNGKPKPCGIPIELADIVIRVADVCGRYGIDLNAAVEEKLAYNKTRPPRHGGMKL